jgi:hypothetical protein
MTTPQLNKPGRPFGLNLAILTVALVFGVMPLLRIGLEVWLYTHFQNFSWTVGTGDEAIDPIMAGIDFDFNYVSGIGQGLLSAAILIFCVMAWRGRPRWARYALLWSVLLIDAIYVLGVILSLTMPPDPSAGMTSADGFANSLQVGFFALLALTTTYLVWYLNREPARAFYRGSFRQDGEVLHELPEVDQLSGTGQT